MSELSRNLPASAPIPPAPDNAVDPSPSVGELVSNDDMILFATALGVRQLLSQVAAGSQIPVPPVIAPESSGVVEPGQSAVIPTQLPANSSEVVINSSQPLDTSKAPAEIVTARSGPDVTPIQDSELASNVTNATTDGSAPKTQYRTRVPAPSRRDSIDGAPAMDLDLHRNPAHPDSVADSEAPELVVDLRDYVSMIDESDDESHVSSSQKTLDECRALQPPSPSPSSQQRASSGLEEVEGISNQPQHHSTDTQEGVDEEDLPTWMLTKGQWEYLATTAGGPAWKNLLSVYMQQERRLEFTDMVSNLSRFSFNLALIHFPGCGYPTAGSTTKDQRVHPVRPPTQARRQPQSPWHRC